MIKAIIVDINSTIANTDHRKHHLEKRPKDWDAWHAAVDNDSLHTDVVSFVEILHIHLNVEILLCSGRHEELRAKTINWLRKKGVKFNRLYMRSDNDHRPDHIIKLELLERIRLDGYDPIAAFDDRNSVVAMWREQGIRCFQVAPGNF